MHILSTNNFSRKSPNIWKFLESISNNWRVLNYLVCYIDVIYNLGNVIISCGLSWNFYSWYTLQSILLNHLLLFIILVHWEEYNHSKKYKDSYKCFYFIFCPFIVQFVVPFVSITINFLYDHIINTFSKKYLQS